MELHEIVAFPSQVVSGEYHVSGIFSAMLDLAKAERFADADALLDAIAEQVEFSRAALERRKAVCFAQRTS